ncbi:hypothetical protein [Arthrobacter sp. VKM Ac-2550]|uniref:hypothetical protein n=1 Tax=Crystallibacter permensis TaxID=1938888 RepID=UPI002226A853|nr:hypothetical protein [Arthrobacter sp. VKM Ac-2550]MCW2130887.1 hypothetical protein [Arthrobacter sp. VKM Ac-2550]
MTASTSGGAELLGRRTGASAGAGLRWAFRIMSEMINTGRQGSVVSLIRDPGDRYLDKYYSDEWLAENKIDVGPYCRRLETFMNTGTLS